MRLFGYNWRWLNMSLLLIPVVLTLTALYKDKYQAVYVPVTWGCCALVLFCNFPSIVIMLHSRPIYYDDLIIKTYSISSDSDDDSEAASATATMETHIFCKKYQKIFLWISTTTSAIMVGLTAELWFYKDSIYGDDAGLVNSVAAMGIVGGILKVYYSSTMAIGALVMFILKYLKRRDQRALLQTTEQRTLIELSDMGVTIGGGCGGTSNSQSGLTEPILDECLPNQTYGRHAMVDIFN